MLDLEDIADVIATAVRDATAPLIERIAVLESRTMEFPVKGDPGKPGADVDMDVVKRLIAEEVVMAVSTLPPAEKGDPGVGLAGALIDRDGSLVLTMSDGSTQNLGAVVGKDGVPGRDGVDGHTFSLDDFDIEPLDERTIKMGFTYGEVKHSFELAIPALIYRGVWREVETYQRGDLCTWGGNIWHCDNDGCATKPDGGAWTLAVKRGRDGKDAAK